MAAHIEVKNETFVCLLYRTDLGMSMECYDYGRLCHERGVFHIAAWFYSIVALLNILLELLNILLLYKRRRSRINLLLGNHEYEK